jgi:hypothetical protein
MIAEQPDALPPATEEVLSLTPFATPRNSTSRSRLASHPGLLDAGLADR